MDAKIQKLEQQYATTAAHNPYKKSDLFAGIAIFVNGLTTPSADELKRIMMTHGGVYHAYYRSGATTYIIAEQLPDVKIRAMRASRTIIRADWVVECVRQMRIVDYTRYLLYTDSSRSDQPKLCFAGGAAVATANKTAAECSTPKSRRIADRKPMQVPATEAAAASRQSSQAADIDQSIQQTGVYNEDDEDMFADDDLPRSMSPMIVLTDIKHLVTDSPKTESLNNSFAVNLNAINVRMRKQPTESKQPQQLDRAPIDIESTMPTAVVKLQKLPSYSLLPEPQEHGSEAPIPVGEPVETTVEVPTLPTQPIDVSEPKPIHAVAGKPSTTVRTAVDPNFLAEFYSNSRLHHIATLGANFKNYISQLRETGDLVQFPARQTITIRAGQTPPPEKSTIMHIDMDCFFVSVGLRTRPALRGQPVAVTHSKGGAQAGVRPGADPERERAMWAQRHRSSANGTTENRVDTKTAALPLEASDSLAEIASCSYEARASGLKNGMFVGAALKLCPQLCTIPYDFEAYKEVAQQLYDTVAK